LEGVDWIDKAENRQQWWAFVDTVWTSTFSKIREISWLSEELLAYQEGPCSMEFVSQSVSQLRSIWAPAAKMREVWHVKEVND
jgi:hypothetical protein